MPGPLFNKFRPKPIMSSSNPCIIMIIDHCTLDLLFTYDPSLIHFYFALWLYLDFRFLSSVPLFIVLNLRECVFLYECIYCLNDFLFLFVLFGMEVGM